MSHTLPSNSVYDKFQNEAISNIVEDFRSNPAGRYLLVIPTGGGKTFTAVRAVCKMYDDGLLNPDSDRVLWVAHRDFLIEQAKKTFNEMPEIYNNKNRSGCIDFRKTQEGYSDGGVENALIKQASLVIIDEAHHTGPSSKSYAALFTENSKAGVLGLTATPSRTDYAPLPFERESYSIGFPHLIELGVLIRPEIIKVQGVEHKSTSHTGLAERINSDERTKNIILAMKQNQSLIQKAIVYTHSVEHANNFYEALLKHPVVKEYKQIGIVTGERFERFDVGLNAIIPDKTRTLFLDSMRATDRAILVNYNVLTEGFDDPSVNTVVMARPTDSKLVYMQAAGRAVRRNKEDPSKKAFIIEVTEHLPNLKYRIDNRWLFCDVSDLLQPAVVDHEYRNEQQFYDTLDKVYTEHCVAAGDRSRPNFDSTERYSLLLFKVYVTAHSFRSVPLILTKTNRQAIVGLFNTMSWKLKTYRTYNSTKVKEIFDKHYISKIQSLQNSDDRFRLMFEAMKNAHSVVNQTSNGCTFTKFSPWITFVTLHHKSAELSDELLGFTEDMINREEVRQQLISGTWNESYGLVRLPEPLKGSTGLFLSQKTLEQTQKLVSNLQNIVVDSDIKNHWLEMQRVFESTTLPVPQKYLHAFATLVREGDLDYFRLRSDY